MASDQRVQSLSGAWVEVRQLTDPSGGLCGGRVVVEVCQSDGRGAHEATVARRAAHAHMQVVCRGRQLRCGGLGSSVGEDAPGLDPDVRRVGVEPGSEARRDPVEGRLVAQVHPGRCHLEDGDRHGRVVGPFAGGEAAEAAADHRRPARSHRGRTELVPRPKRVTDGRAEHRTAGAIELRRRQSDGPHQATRPPVRSERSPEAWASTFAKDAGSTRSCIGTNG
jgi:hypothetical protein